MAEPDSLAKLKELANVQYWDIVISSPPIAEMRWLVYATDVSGRPDINILGEGESLEEAIDHLWDAWRKLKGKGCDCHG